MGVVDISGLPKSQSFKINGVSQNQYVVSSSIVCDLDEDGNQDIILGNALQSNNQGTVYVIWGDGSFNNLQFNNTTEIVPPHAIAISASTTFQYVGASLACIDINQNGHQELVIGAYGYQRAPSDTPGAVYVIYFNGTRITNNINVQTLTSSQGFRFPGTANTDQFGFDMDNAGDVNGDGWDDLVVSAPYASGAGKVYVIYSKPGLNAFDVSTLNTDANSGFLLQGTTGSSFGYSVRKAGDFNNDGYADLVVGAFHSNFAGINTGSAYVVFGNATRATPTFINGLTNMLRFDGNPSGQQPRLGHSVGSAGYFDGDDYADIVINAPFESSPVGVRSVGYSFIVFGKSNFPNITNVNAFGSDAIKIYGREAYAGIGYSTSGGGDLNGDGFDDIVTCEHYSFLRSDGERDGACYVLFGNTLQRNTNFNINTLSDTQGYMLRAFSYGRLGHSSLSFGNGTDINNDGYPDIFVSAPLAAPNGITSAGTFYAISGRLAPIVTTSSGAANFTKNTVPTIIDSGVTVVDNNNPTLVSAEIQISDGFVNGDILGFVNQSGITGQYNSSTGVLTLTGTANVDIYQTALQSITFENNELTFSNRTISFTVNNGAKMSDAATRSVDLVPLDNLLSGTATNLLCLNQQNSQFLFPQLSIVGGNDVVLQNATVAINNVMLEDSLIFTDMGGQITANYSSASGTLTFTGPATAADFEQVLRTVEYKSSNDTTTQHTKEVMVSVNFNDQASNTITSHIDLVTINDIPLVVNPIEDFNVTAGEAFTKVLVYPFDQSESVLSTSVVGENGGTSFNFSTNTLSGTLTSVGTNQFSFFGSDRCNQTAVSNFTVNAIEPPPVILPADVPSKGGSSNHTGAIVGGVIGGVAGLMCLGGIVLGGFWMRKKKQPEEEVEMQGVQEEQVVQASPIYQKKGSWYSPIYRSVSRALFGKKPSKVDVVDVSSADDVSTTNDISTTEDVSTTPEGP